jgi:hypothetical protein
MKLVSIKVASAVIAGLGLSLGAVGAVSAYTDGSLSDTGRNSDNVITASDTTTSNTINGTNVGVTNNNPQTATSGSATVKHNDDSAGDATTGDAGNQSEVTVDGTINYGSHGSSDESAATASAGASASISNTGRNSANSVNTTSTSATNKTNSTTIAVTNNNVQTATSGSAAVTGNENGGNATSGAASNSSSVNTALSLSY